MCPVVCALSVIDKLQGLQLTEPAAVKDAQLNLRIVLLDPDGLLDPVDSEVKQLPAAQTEELTRQVAALQSEDTRNLSTWEVVAIVIGCLVATYMAYTVAQFAREHVATRKHCYAQRGLISRSSSVPVASANNWIGTLDEPAPEPEVPGVEDSAGMLHGFASAVRRPWGALQGSATAGHSRFAHQDSLLSPAIDDAVPCYSYQYLASVCENFSATARTGSGGFGAVYRGCLNYTPVAVKVLNLEGMQGEPEFLAEVEVLSKVSHPNIVLLIGCCRESGRQCLVYEWMANGSLQDHLTKRSPIPWSARLSIAVDITRALCFLHGHPSQEITHRDIKPANILLDDRFTAKVSDVGLARVARPAAEDGAAINHGNEQDASSCTAREESPDNGRGQDHTTTQHSRRHPRASADVGVPSSSNQQQPSSDTHRVGTPAYMDPEYRATGSFDPSCDVYALGICFLQLVTAMPPHGLRTIVDRAMGTGKPSSMVDLSDPYAGQWPLGVLRQMFLLSLRCTAERAVRPTLHQVMVDLHAVVDSTRQA